MSVTEIELVATANSQYGTGYIESDGQTARAQSRAQPADFGAADQPIQDLAAAPDDTLSRQRLSLPPELPVPSVETLGLIEKSEVAAACGAATDEHPLPTAFVSRSSEPRTPAELLATTADIGADIVPESDVHQPAPATTSKISHERRQNSSPPMVISERENDHIDIESDTWRGRLRAKRRKITVPSDDDSDSDYSPNSDRDALKVRRTSPNRDSRICYESDPTGGMSHVWPFQGYMQRVRVEDTCMYKMMFSMPMANLNGSDPDPTDYAHDRNDESVSDTPDSAPAVNPPSHPQPTLKRGRGRPRKVANQRVTTHPGRQHERPNPAQREKSAEAEEFVVEKIVGHDFRCQVKWEGDSAPTWEPLENLTNCDDLLREYLRRQQLSLQMILHKLSKS